MPQTKEGAIKARQTMIDRYGADFYKVIGSKGGKNGTTGGFGAGKEGRLRAIEAGRKGGLKSRRGKKQQ